MSCTNPLTQREEHWCGNCPHGGRWGNHPTKDHETWQAEQKRRNEARKKKQKDTTPSTTDSGAPGPAPAPTPAVTPPASSSGPGTTTGPLEVTHSSLRFCSSAMTSPGF
jgi:hypothetical protein